MRRGRQQQKCSMPLCNSGIPAVGCTACGQECHARPHPSTHADDVAPGLTAMLFSARSASSAAAAGSAAAGSITASTPATGAAPSPPPEPHQAAVPLARYPAMAPVLALAATRDTMYADVWLYRHSPRSRLHSRQEHWRPQASRHCELIGCFKTWPACPRVWPQAKRARTTGTLSNPASDAATWACVVPVGEHYQKRLWHLNQRTHCLPARR